MIGTTELIIVLAVAALLFGTNKLPDIARQMGKAMGEFKKAQRDFESELKFEALPKQDASGPKAPESTAKSDANIEDKIKKEVTKRVGSKLKPKTLK